MSICLSVCPSVHTFVCLSIHLTNCLPLHLSVFPPVNLFFCSTFFPYLSIINLIVCTSVHLSVRVSVSKICLIQGGTFGTPRPRNNGEEHKSIKSNKLYEWLKLLGGGFRLLVWKHQFFPIVILMSPALLIIYEFLSVLKPENKFIDAQSKLATRGESALETSPQLILQFYNILLSWHDLTFGQQFSIISSFLSLRFVH